MPKKKTSKPKPKSPADISSLTHKEAKRANIPTEELRDFMADDEKAPKTVLYPRDPSLDPQLVWRGKDEQDSKPLEVPSVPIYIQEKIHPQALVENLRETAQAGEEEPELALFNDFNGIKFEDMIEFYQHEQHWQNRMILGDSLLVMNSLAEKERLRGKVQMIFMDPPYGIKFGSNWQVSTSKNLVRDGQAADTTRQPEQIKAFRDTWELGIHSYLSYLRDRLVVSRELLSSTGSIFIQIGDENIHLVRSILDEVFGSENCMATITFKKTAGLAKEEMSSVSDFLLWYAKDIQAIKPKRLFLTKSLEHDAAYSFIEEEDGYRHRLTNTSEDIHSESKIYRLQTFTAAGLTPSCVYPINCFGKTINPPNGTSWKTNLIGSGRLVRANRLVAGGSSLSYLRYLQDFSVNPLNNFWSDTASGSGMSKVYVVQTNELIIQRCLLMTTKPGDLVLDPTCGSGTTAYVAEQWGRRWITIDTSRVALALARTRLMSAKFPYYILKDTPEGRKRELELMFGKTASEGMGSSTNPTTSDIAQGFVYKRVPHVTLKSIANNEEIDVIYSRYEEVMAPLLKDLNKLTKSKFEDWEIPREGKDDWSEKAKSIHAEWWKLRRARQKEIDDSISRRADIEFLYDQPEEDKKRIRVTGPFTVESLSPHRMLSMDESPIGGAPEPSDLKGSGETQTQSRKQESDFVTIILDNLRKSSIQTTHKEERLTFDRIEQTSNPYIHAKGVYTDKDGKERLAAITIGPEHGTVSPDLVREAAKAAVQSIEKYDSLYILGFSFDPYVDTERTKLGKLSVIMTRMNPDLAMGDELLKKTGAGNLFMVFGEPDITIKNVGNGELVVEIFGLDVYDPTTGAVRSDSTDDIACWFIDTNYNGESFFVRHAYFTGANDPYKRLKSALKAEIDEATWDTLYRTESRPFEKPRTGKIAVKVINHYGDEVLRVYEVK